MFTDFCKEKITVFREATLFAKALLSAALGKGAVRGMLGAHSFMGVRIQTKT